jgi:serine protease Do
MVAADIGETLTHTKRATFSVLVKAAKGEEAQLVGTGFFVNDEGLFATAAHVVKGVKPIALFKEAGADAVSGIPIESEYVFYDEEADFALLRATRDAEREQEFGQPTFLQPSGRALAEGSAVYAFGYPLPEGSGIALPPAQLRELLGDGPADLLPKIGPNQVFSVPNYVLCPRTTSAIIASEIDYSRTFDPQGRNHERNFYTLDKALNPGNSGGPVIAPQTGHVHAVCTAYQVHSVPQKHLENVPIAIPSLYGYVTRLTHPTIRQALETNGVEFRTD